MNTNNKDKKTTEQIILSLEDELDDFKKVLEEEKEDTYKTVETLTHKVIQALNQRDEAIETIKQLVKNNISNICSLCSYNHKCEGKKCKDFIQGKGMQLIDTLEYIDEPWTCMDFNFGTCPTLEHTPCNGCIDNDFENFHWIGLDKQDKDKQDKQDK